ncbi:iron-sulfur cluster assembly scaffold protein [Hellea sp.]|nr:iron-sulfur cluster assembly scaffold protein [Hellea sp.]
MTRHGSRHRFALRRDDKEGTAPYIFSMFDDLYNTEILTLSASLKNERLDAPDGTARKVSKLCGSWLEIDVKVDGDIVSDVALRVQACALGQSSAAILQQGIIGASLEEITEARNALREMLKSDGEAPTGQFEKLALLKGVKAYPARHTSTMLAFDAAVEAVERASL